MEQKEKQQWTAAGVARMLILDEHDKRPRLAHAIMEEFIDAVTRDAR